MHVADPTPCLSVVVPCYNERSTVESVVATVLASPWTAEVIVVDDGSTDGTRDLLPSLEGDRVRVFYQDVNQGKGAALRRGFAEATAPYVIVQDADLEYDPAEFGALVQPLLNDDADVVYGSRFHSSQPHRVLYFWHSVGNKFLTMLSNMFTNLNLTDMETCYKVFRREVIQSITIEEERFGFEPEVTAKVAAAGWRVYELGIGYHGRTYDEGKKIGWRDGVRAVWCIVKYSGAGAKVREAVDPGVVGSRPVPVAAPTDAVPEPPERAPDAEVPPAAIVPDEPAPGPAAEPAPEPAPGPVDVESLNGIHSTPGS
jgi:glycosyltransferase involved in cell wall biosynthesis